MYHKQIASIANTVNVHIPRLGGGGGLVQGYTLCNLLANFMSVTAFIIYNFHNTRVNILSEMHLHVIGIKTLGFFTNGQTFGYLLMPSLTSIVKNIFMDT